MDFPLNFSFTCGCVEICAVVREDFSLLFAGVTWWKRFAEITEERARLWNKKVNLLVVCFAGYECF